jgi:hypothetical protein
VTGAVFEHVLRVDDWYDGVREGVALYRGAPHHFRWLGWDGAEWDPDDDRFLLTPVEPGAGAPLVARGEFRNSATAPEPHFSTLRPQEVRWTPVE